MTYLEPISGESSYEYKPNLKQIWISERKWQGSIASVQKKARHTERKCICWTNYYPKQRGIVVRFESEMGAYLLYAYPYYLLICTFPWIYVNICACKCMYNIYVYITYLYIYIIYIHLYIVYTRFRGRDIWRSNILKFEYIEIYRHQHLLDSWKMCFTCRMRRLQPVHQTENFFIGRAHKIVITHMSQFKFW